MLNCGGDGDVDVKCEQSIIFKDFGPQNKSHGKRLVNYFLAIKVGVGGGGMAQGVTTNKTFYAETTRVS